MQWHVSIDDMQEEKFIDPIWNSLLRQNIDNSVFKQLYFDCQLPMYFKHLPDTLKNDPVFLKEAMARDMIYYSDIPAKFQNMDFITKEEYMNMLEKNYVTLETPLYPLDIDIVKNAFHNLMNNRFYLPAEYLNNVDLILERSEYTDDIFNFIPQDVRQNIFQDENRLAQVIEKQPKYFEQLSEEQKTQDNFLKAVLTQDTGLKHCRDYLKKSRDPEIALRALEINSSIAKELNQKFWMVIKTHGAKDDAYNFLKTWLLKEEFQKNIQPHEPAKANKAKI